MQLILEEITRLIEILNDKGSGAIFWKDLKPLVRKLATSPLTPRYVMLGAAYYFRDAPKGLRTYINDIYLGGIKNENCRKAASLWFDKMAQPTSNTSSWALRMFDASGKPPANLLAANTNWLGNWNSCHKVKYSNADETFKFKGRYCRAKVRAEPCIT